MHVSCIPTLMQDMITCIASPALQAVVVPCALCVCCMLLFFVFGGVGLTVAWGDRLGEMERMITAAAALKNDAQDSDDKNTMSVSQGRCHFCYTHTRCNSVYSFFRYSSHKHSNNLSDQQLPPIAPPSIPGLTPAWGDVAIQVRAPRKRASKQSNHREDANYAVILDTQTS